jgi:glycosyltransferase involved in cell wall biosynthesis
VREPYDVVFLYAPPWAGPTRFSKHHLAAHFAAHGHRVLYVEAPLTPLGLRRGAAFVRELRATLASPQPARERLWVRRHFVPVPYHGATALTSTRAANRIGQRLLAPAVRRDMQRLGMGRPVLIAGLPHAVDVLPRLPRRCVVYHCADDYASVRGFPSTLPAVEADLCRQAQLVIATSQTLCTDRERFNPNTHWVPNGADVDHFAQSAEPAAELRALPRPVIGFVGGLSQWVDVPLIASLATARREWSFVLIGPIGIDVSAVAHLGNVHLLGPRPYEHVPSYLAAMEVAVIPFRDEPVTYHADPIKAYEYLAAGVPVVATDLPALRRLQPLVRLAHGNDAFLSELDAAVAVGREACARERQAEARRHSWESRFTQVRELIEAVCGC